jgi:hypothetical protein
MSDNSVNESITIDEDEDNIKSDNVNTFQDAIKGMGEIVFDKYPKKTSNLSQENINGIIMGEVLNEYMDVNFGYRYKAIDKLIEQKQIMVVSDKGWGMEMFKEMLKSIQASFEQTQLPVRMQDMLRR